MGEFTVKEVKSHTISADGGTVKVVLAGKYVPEMTLVMSPECLDGMMVALRQIRAPTGPQAQPEQRPGKAAAQSPDPIQVQAPAPGKGATGEVTVRRPKTWMVAAETKVNNLVLLIFDFKTATQTGFGLDPKGAKELAAGLLKNAEAIVKARN